MIHTLAASPPIVHPVVQNDTPPPQRPHQPLRCSKSAPGSLASFMTENRVVSVNDDFEPMDTDAPADTVGSRLADTSAAYLKLRNIDKRYLFEALDRTAAAALLGPLTEAETDSFVTACRDILALEVQASRLANLYAQAFQEIKARQANGSATPAEIDWLAGGSKNLNAPGALLAVERLITTEQLTKATQQAVFGGELERIFATQLPDHEKVIVARSTQRFLNATTLVLNSPLGGPAIVNLQALQALVGCADWPAPQIPPGAQWTPESVRNLLIDRLDALVRHILEPNGKWSGLSEPARQALKQACSKVLEVVDAQGGFKVPQSWMAKTGVRSAVPT